MDYHAFQRLLIQADDPQFAEQPPGWDRAHAEARFTQLAQAIIQRLGQPCSYETGTAIQDASFHGQLVIPRTLLTADDSVSLRVSNFGAMATVYDDESIVAPPAFVAIRDLLPAFGYIYVPSWILRAPYTGHNPAVSCSYSWGYRYFDYL